MCGVCVYVHCNDSLAMCCYMWLSKQVPPGYVTPGMYVHGQCVRYALFTVQEAITYALERENGDIVTL